MRGTIIATCALLVAGSVWADPKDDKDKKADKKKKKDKKKDKDKDKKDSPEIEMEVDATAPTPPPPTTTTTTTVTPDPATTSVTATPAPPAPGGFPLQIDNRPLTLPKSKLDFHAGFPILVYSVPTVMGPSTTNTAAGFAIGAAYGVDDKIEIGGDYALSLSPGNIKGPLTFHSAYRFKADPKLEVAFAGALALDFVDVTNTAGMTSTTTFFGLQFGAWVRYHLASNVSLFTGSPGLPSSAVPLNKFSLPLPPLAYQLQVGLAGGAAIAIELPVGIGFQATPNIYTFASINIANIKLKDTQNAFLFADFIPLALGGFYSMDKLDIGAVFADDLENAGSHLAFTIAARYFMK